MPSVCLGMSSIPHTSILCRGAWDTPRHRDTSTPGVGANVLHPLPPSPDGAAGQPTALGQMFDPTPPRPPLPAAGPPLARSPLAATVAPAPPVPKRSLPTAHPPAKRLCREEEAWAWAVGAPPLPTGRPAPPSSLGVILRPDLPVPRTAVVNRPSPPLLRPPPELIARDGCCPPGLSLPEKKSILEFSLPKPVGVWLPSVWVFRVLG